MAIGLAPSICAIGDHQLESPNAKWGSWTWRSRFDKLAKPPRPAPGPGPRAERRALCAPLRHALGWHPSGPVVELRRVRHAMSALYPPPLLHAGFGIPSPISDPRGVFVLGGATNRPGFRSVPPRATRGPRESVFKVPATFVLCACFQQR
jgi:hypothetical protein